MTAPTEALYLADPDDLESLFPDEPPYRTRQLKEWLYHSPVLDPGDMTNLPKSLRADLSDRLWPFDVTMEQSADAGRTRKWLFRGNKDASIESVLMGYRKRNTLCISSQAGCAMGCTFCATGQFGFERHLEPGEIVAQVAYARASLQSDPLPDCPDRLSNIVFMGMGEPLANYRRVRESLRRMIEVMGISARSITVSTVGVVPGIRKLADEPWPVNLAISLHAAKDDIRSSLVPLNDRYPIADLIEAARYFFKSHGRRVSIEWTVIDGKNDDRNSARDLARVARRMRAHVNVIPLNPTPMSQDRPPDAGGIARFMAALADEGVNATLRDTRGSDIDAACGQLRIRAARTPESRRRRAR